MTTCEREILAIWLTDSFRNFRQDVDPSPFWAWISKLAQESSYSFLESTEHEVLEEYLKVSDKAAWPVLMFRAVLAMRNEYFKIFPNENEIQVTLTFQK